MRVLLRILLALIALGAAYAISAFLSLPLCYFTGMGLTAALWASNLVAVVIACCVSWACLRLTRKWTPTRLGITFGSALCLIGLAFGGFWCLVKRTNPFRDYDSEKEVVRLERINSYLTSWTGTPLPPSAQDVHVYIGGGVDPRIVLKFGATGEDVRRFVERSRQRFQEGWHRGQGPVPEWVTQIAHKDWWTPVKDSDWLEYPHFLFIQVDKEENTVYLAGMST